MKHTILIIMLFFAGQIFAQNETKSEQIAKEIQSLELENNYLILNEYIKEQCDTTSNIPIQNFSRKLVTDFQNKHQDLKELKDEFDKYKYFNLIDGKPIKLRIQKNVNNSNIKIKPLLNKIDIIKLNLDNKEILINDLLYIDIKTEIKEFYSIKFFDLTEIMSNI